MGLQVGAWRRRARITVPIVAGDMGARRAAASQRGFEEERERERLRGMGGDGTALAEGISDRRRVSNDEGPALAPGGAPIRRHSLAHCLAHALTTACGDPDHLVGMSVLHGLVTALLGAGLGVQIFLSFLVAPAAFRVVDRPVAARVMEGVFPGYYGFGLATTTMALLLVLALSLRHPSPLRWGTAALVGLTLAGTVYAGHVLLPQAHAARLRAQAAPAGDLAPLEFSRLHRRAVAVNIAIFAAGAVALALHLATVAVERVGAGSQPLTSRVSSQRQPPNHISGQGFQS